MAPAEPYDDYYAVLEVSNIATIEVVTKSYRRLAKIRHPDKNLEDDSTAVFQLLQNAYDIISDPAKRRAYDLRWSGIRDGLRAQHESDRRQAQAAETEKKRAAEERARKQKEDDARQERLRSLDLSKSRYDDDIFEVSRVVNKLTADLKRLQDQDDEDTRKERERNGWWAYLASPIYGKADETDEQKQERETKRLHRLASNSIKGSELHEKEARLQRLQDAVQDVNGKIAAEKKKVEDEARARRLRMEREAEIRANREMRDRMAKAQKERAERAERAAREAQAAREAREAQERARMAAAAERRRREEEERAQAMRVAEEAARKAKKTRNDWSEPGTRSTCRHDRFWPKAVNTYTRSYVVPGPDCHRVKAQGPALLVALFITKLSEYFTIFHIDTVLVSSQCTVCGQLDAYVFLPGLQRCCQRYAEQYMAFMPISQDAAKKQYGVRNQCRRLGSKDPGNEDCTAYKDVGVYQRNWALLPLPNMLPKEGNVDWRLYCKGRILAYNKATTYCMCASIMPVGSGDSWEDCDNDGLSTSNHRWLTDMK